MNEPIDEGLWDRIRDNEKHYSRLLHMNQKHFEGQFEISISTPDIPNFDFSSLFSLDGWNANKEHTGVEITELYRNGLSVDASMRLHGKVRNFPPSNMFFDFEYTDSVARARILRELGIGLACPHARGEKGEEGVDGIPGVRHEVIVMPSPIKLPDWSKEILKFQSGDTEVEEVEGPAISQSDADLHMHLMGSMFQTFAPEIRDAAKLIGNEEAIDIVMDAFGGSPYMENLDELTPEQIAIHNPPVKPMYRVPPRPEPKPRCEVGKRKSVAKAARKRAQAGRKKNRG